MIADSLNLFTATRYNLYFGIPDPLLYLLGGELARIFELGVTFFIGYLIYLKVIPPGIETTLSSLSMTVFFFWFLIRQFIGVLINDTFFHVSSADMSNYVYLRIISLVTSTLPLFYLKFAVPKLAEV